MKISAKYLFRTVLLVVAASAATNAAAQRLAFDNLPTAAVEITPDASAGLAAVYVLDSTQGVKASYTASSASATLTCYRFSTLGGGYAEPIFSTRNGATVTFALDAADMGYIVDDNGRQQCFWVVNYSDHTFSLQSLTLSEADCNGVTLHLEGSAARIPYYTINGRAITLSRGITLEYYNLEFDSEAFAYKQIVCTDEIEYIDSDLAIRAPFCATDFKLTGDRFLSAWGREVSATASGYSPMAVEANTEAEQTERSVENEITETTDGLGGSAPVEIAFRAAVTDAAVYREWQISRDPNFSTLENSFRELDLTYTFTDNGTTYVRFMAADMSGVCEYYGPTYNVFIGESKLTCPNAFSPGASPGVNDEWRVSYKSIVSFDCHIFSRWGKEVWASTDPALGWDGKHGGKLVPAGVYYYVIRAKGADGVDYKLSGDINIVNYKAGTTGTTTGDATE